MQGLHMTHIAYEVHTKFALCKEQFLVVETGGSNVLI